ncbi:MAG: hypothetical protein LCH84_18420 [Gemmatimonadetes bacterium]|nr:hypothetical protein [Gemmatimonadota bacterium]
MRHPAKLRRRHRAVVLCAVPLALLLMAARATDVVYTPRETPRLAAGRQAYRLVQQTTLKMEGALQSPDGGARTERDIWFTYEAVATAEGTLAVTMRVDSAFVTSPAAQHARIAEATGAGWRAVVDSTGRRLSSSLLADLSAPNGTRKLDGLGLTPLVWMLPLLAPEGTDSLALPGAKMGEIPVTVGAKRRCAAADARSVRMTAEMRATVPQGAQLTGRPMTLHSKGAMEGRWTLTAAGLLDSADVSFRVVDDVMVGPMGITRNDHTTMTLRRVP